MLSGLKRLKMTSTRCMKIPTWKKMKTMQEAYMKILYWAIILKISKTCDLFLIKKESALVSG